MSATWDGALRAFATALDAQQEALDAGTAVPAFAPLHGLGPVPDALRPEAEALLARSRALEHRAARELAHLERDLESTRRHVGAVSLYVDQRA